MSVSVAVCLVCWLQVPYTYSGVTFNLSAGVELLSVDVYPILNPKLEVMSCLRVVSLLTTRSGFGSPSSPTLTQANPPPPSQRDSLFAFGSGSNAQRQHQQMQSSLPPGFGGVHSSGGPSQGGHQAKAPPLGSGRGLETMPEDDDTMVRPSSEVHGLMCI